VKGQTRLESCDRWLFPGSDIECLSNDVDIWMRLPVSMPVVGRVHLQKYRVDPTWIPPCTPSNTASTSWL
jgi:hypothetical protein